MATEIGLQSALGAAQPSASALADQQRQSLHADRVQQEAQIRVNELKQNELQEPQEPQVQQEQDTFELEKVVSNINDFVQSIQRNLKFSVDDDSGRTVVKVIDAETEKLVRQIPADEVLNFVHRLKESDLTSGVILRADA